MGGWYVELDNNDQPLCPKSMGMTTPGYDAQVDRHMQWVQIQDRVYNDTKRFPRDEDHELTGGAEMELAYNKAVSDMASERLGIRVSDPYDDRMNLHVVTAAPAYDNRAGIPIGTVFKTAYLVCPVCLFILPGQMGKR